MSTRNNREYARKDTSHIFQVSDLISSGGRLYPEQVDYFMQEWADQPGLLNLVGIEPMLTHTKELTLGGFGSRIFHKATAASDISTSDYASFTPRKVQIVAQKVKAVVAVDDDVYEENIARNTFDDFMMARFKEQGALDMEEYALKADESSTDSDLTIFDGFIKLASVANGATVVTPDSGHFLIGTDPLQEAIYQLPAKYKAVRSQLVYLCGHGFWEAYTDALGLRTTALGDQALTAEPGVIKYKGIPIIPLTWMPETTILLSPKTNFKIGILRNMRLASERVERTETTYWVLTTRMGVEFLDCGGVVKVTGIGSDIESTT